MHEHVSANKPRILTGAVALTSGNELYQHKVPKQPRNSNLSGIQWRWVIYCFGACVPADHAIANIRL